MPCTIKKKWQTNQGKKQYIIEHVASLEGITRCFYRLFAAFSVLLSAFLLPIFNRPPKKVLNGKNSVSDDIKGP
jgi:hypothetical protein